MSSVMAQVEKFWNPNIINVYSRTQVKTAQMGWFLVVLLSSEIIN